MKMVSCVGSSVGFVYALVYAFLREVYALLAFWVYNPLVYKYTTIRSTIVWWGRECLVKSLHSIHQQSQSIHQSLHKAYIKACHSLAVCK